MRADRRPDHGDPLFPLLRGLRFVVGVQEQPQHSGQRPCWRSSWMRPHPVDGDVLASLARRPVVGPVGVVWRGEPVDQLVPDDPGPGQLGEVDAASAVAEHLRSVLAGLNAP